MKKKWVDIELARIKVNPEHAVLACCTYVSICDDAIVVGTDWSNGSQYQ